MKWLLSLIFRNLLEALVLTVFLRIFGMVDDYWVGLRWCFALCIILELAWNGLKSLGSDSDFVGPGYFRPPFM